MKSTVILTFFCLLMFLFFSPAAPGENVAAPQIIIPEAFHDFKVVDEGSVLEHTFKVKNRGGQILDIKRVRPG